MSPWLGMALVVGALAGLLGGLRLVQRWASPHPELVRKALHVGMGLVTVSFPWVFEAFWPVLLLGALSLAGMVALRTVKGLRAGVGQVVGGVSRASLGEAYFPLAVVILFYLYRQQVEAHPEDEYAVYLYCIPILLLALADAAAALVGVQYGQWRYSTSDGQKSTEGSIAFFLCAFFCAHVPLLLGTNLGRAETLLIALLLAWLAMLFEAIAWAGLDNLALPLVAHLLLKIYLGLSVEELIGRLAVTAALMLFVFLYRKRTTLHGSALLGACVVGYITYALGDWRWMLPPLILFLGYKALTSGRPRGQEQQHNIHAVVCVSAAGLIWLFLFKLLNRPELEHLFYYLFTLSFAAQMAIIAVAGLGFKYPGLSGPALLGACVLEGCLLMFVPYLILEWSWPRCVPCALVALPGVALAAAGFYLTQRRDVRDCPASTARWVCQGACGGLGSAVGLVPVWVF
jgi:phytol kinase